MGQLRCRRGPGRFRPFPPFPVPVRPPAPRWPPAPAAVAAVVVLRPWTGRSLSEVCCMFWLCFEKYGNSNTIFVLVTRSPEEELDLEWFRFCFCFVSGDGDHFGKVDSMLTSQYHFRWSLIRFLSLLNHPYDSMFTATIPFRLIHKRSKRVIGGGRANQMLAFWQGSK